MSGNTAQHGLIGTSATLLSITIPEIWLSYVGKLGFAIVTAVITSVISSYISSKMRK